MAIKQIKPTEQDKIQEKAWELRINKFFNLSHWCEICDCYKIFVPKWGDEKKVMCSTCFTIYDIDFFANVDSNHRPLFVQQTALRLSYNEKDKGEWFYSD